jgi:hypothetical protein
MFAVLAGLAAATTVNVPGIFIGYGLVYVVMLLAAWLFRPVRAALLVLVAMLIALPFYVLPHSVFAAIALFPVILRPLLTYVSAKVNVSRGKLASALVLSTSEVLAALTIGILYYGVDGEETSFAVFGIILSLFAYPIFFYATKNGAMRAVGLVAGLLALFGYYFAIYAFPAIWTVLFAVLSLTILLLAMRREPEKKRLLSAALLLGLIGLALGGQPLAHNLSAGLYPFNPASWGSSRWANDAAPCPLTANAFASVHDPARLRIISACVTVVGVVGSGISSENDGDFTFYVKPTQENSSLLAIGNYILFGGLIHPEVVPADQQKVLGPVGGGVCPGDKVKIIGPVSKAKCDPSAPLQFKNGLV